MALLFMLQDTLADAEDKTLRKTAMVERFNNTLGSMDAEELVDTMSNTLTKAVVLFKALADTLA